MKNIFLSQRQRQEKLIAEIHNEFDTAQDRLLKQAEEIILSATAPFISKEAEIGERLAKVGFVNTPFAKEFESLNKKRDESRTLVVKTSEQANLITYYKSAYPFLKFLTEEELNRICTKYNLIHAPVKNYIKHVPEKNLKDIERAQSLKDKDDDSVTYFISGRDPMQFALFLNSIGKTSAYFTKTEIKDLFYKYYGRENYSNYDSPREYSDKMAFSFSIYDLLILAWDGSGRKGSYDIIKAEKINKSGLFIAAPVSHFDLKDTKKKSKFGFFNVEITEVKDPIVFRYCKGGIQVLTKWGLEAEDELLINSIDN